MKILWQWTPFSDLTPTEQYEMHRLRQEVFVVEQNCIYLDADGIDLEAWHLLGWNAKHELIAYLRVIPDKEKGMVKIGRIVTAKEVRGKGIGKCLMLEALKLIKETFGNITIKMSAQTYLEKFYQNFGFKKNSELYLEDGIPHIEMCIDS